MAIQYKTPHKYEDSDIWFRFFTKTDIAILIIPVYIDFKIVAANFSAPLINWFFAVLFASIITVPFIIIAKLTVPQKMPLYGGGITCRKMAVRLLAYYVFKSGRTIYIRNYNKDKEVKRL